MVHPASFDVFRDLRTKCLSEYFPEELLPEHGHAHAMGEALNFPPAVLTRFHKDFDQLLHNRRSLQGLSRAKQFTKWWKDNKDTFLTRPVMKTYTDSKMTLGEFLDDLHLQYLTRLEAERSGSTIGMWSKRVSKNRAVLALTLFFALSLEKSAAFLWSLILLGPGVQMFNSYTQPVITPLAQTAQQTGARDLGPVAAGIQGWLSNREKLKEVNDELKDVTDELKRTDFSKMKAEEAKARWAKFEESFFALFLRYNQTLPSHLRDGRGVVKDLMIFTPVGLAANIATFDTQYWTHRRELRDARPGSREAQMHKAEMQAAEQRIAGALAAWKVFEFMYPEVVRNPANAQSGANLQNSYRTFSKSMRFDLYVQQFASQMQTVLTEMDSQFLMQDALARMKVAAMPAAGGRTL